MNTDWVILGASSLIAKSFARQVAKQSHQLILVGRDKDDLLLTANDLTTRYQVRCSVFTADLSIASNQDKLFELIDKLETKTSLFIAHAVTYQNDELDRDKINQMLNTNVLATTQIIHRFVYFSRKPNSLIYLSSVAGDRGRVTNSLYGGSKKVIDLFLEGLKASQTTVNIYSIRLGYIDTHQTYGKPGSFLAKSPKDCARFLLRVHNRELSRRYYPWFWRYIMWVIRTLPEKLFNQLKI